MKEEDKTKSELIAELVALRQRVAELEKRENQYQHSEKALRLNEERFLMLLENMKDYAIFFLDPDGRVIKWGAGAESILGYQEAEILGKSGSIIFTPEDRDRGEDRKERVKALTEGRAENERWHVRKDGSRFWGSGIVTSLRDESGQVQGLAKIMRDFTDRKQAEEERTRLLARAQEACTQAESANRMKDEFLATLSHELRSPLNAMLGWTSLLRTRKFDAATTARAIETIERNAKAQARLIEDLLDVSRIIRGQLRLTVRSMELIPVIESAINTVRPAADAKNIQVHLLVDTFVGLISGDPDRLQQIIWNLLTNAIKFTPEGGRVEVYLQGDRSHAEISVRDTGEGISPDFLPYVFDRFRQADNSITRSYTGLGLGLAIVRHLVELHGGTVRAESPGEGQGSTFIVKLPLLNSAGVKKRTEEEESLCSSQSSALNPQESPPTLWESPLDGLQILVVDDEADARELLKSILEQYGAEAIAVASAEEAIGTIQKSKPDLLISDIGMPNEDGYSLIRRVRALEAEKGQIPSVALTAYVRVDDQKAALSAGFQSHVAKPIDPTELIAVVASLVGRTGNV
ncbi:response regulator [Coleofasciculus sp. FACHB-712]|uniref:hybrid sensor histidine kinase/response regulator n=1 Tax=Coleofasciculus sp. FACHB-712 TaxID=2692789 RepID=UPI0016844317|nr:ATP-binding protein [Coleofasciculus sp. FACHB-712]MBD1944396.1 response regulator [Coleofasciculus sp. FACHB-712]